MTLNVFEELNDEEVMAEWYCDENAIPMKLWQPDEPAPWSHGDKGTLTLALEDGSTISVTVPQLEKLDGVLQVTYADDRWRVTRVKE